MSHKNDPIIDDDNPEWTGADFSRALTGKEIPGNVLASFPRTRARTMIDRKISVHLRLSPEVVSHFQANGIDWEDRIDEALLRVIAR